MTPEVSRIAHWEVRTGKIDQPMQHRDRVDPAHRSDRGSSRVSSAAADLRGWASGECKTAAVCTRSTSFAARHCHWPCAAQQSRARGFRHGSLAGIRPGNVLTIQLPFGSRRCAAKGSVMRRKRPERSSIAAKFPPHILRSSLPKTVMARRACNRESTHRVRSPMKTQLRPLMHDCIPIGAPFLEAEKSSGRPIPAREPNAARAIFCHAVEQLLHDRVCVHEISSRWRWRASAPRRQSDARYVRAADAVRHQPSIISLRPPNAAQRIAAITALPSVHRSGVTPIFLRADAHAKSATLRRILRRRAAPSIA